LAPREAIPGAETARVRYLSEAECVRLVNACELAFRNLVRGALLTGCRYSELTAMHAADFTADAGVVTVRKSKMGKPRHVVLTDQGSACFFSSISVGRWCPGINRRHSNAARGTPFPASRTSALMLED
jgi:integrase